MDLFAQLGLIIILATLFAYIAKLLRQPLIPAFISVGILLGPVLGLVTDPELIQTLSEIGIAFLLFSVGLSLDFKRLRNVGVVASVGALVQFGILFLAGMGAGLLLGFSMLTGVYLGLVLAFSSTMVVISILEDRKELDTLHGRILIGILLMQDLIAILAITVLSKSTFSGIEFFATIGEGAVVTIIALLSGKYLFPRLFRYAAKSQELLFLVSLSAVFAFALIFASIGFSLIIGAFVAGVVLGNLPYNVEIVSRLRSLKDFFGVLFFVSIGTELVFVDFTEIGLTLGVFLALTVIFLPLITLLMVSFFGYKKRTAFLTGISLAQVSEFSLILVSQGLTQGHISTEIFSVTIILTIITITLTSYFLQFERPLYRMCKPFLKVFDKFSKRNREYSSGEVKEHEVILLGMDRIGYSIFRTLERLGKDFIVVDFNPETIRRLVDQKVPCLYGDVGDLDILHKLHLKHARIVISTVPDLEANLLLVKTVKHRNRRSNVIVTSYNVDEALKLYEAGADYVIIPHYLGGEHISLMLEDVSDNLDKLIYAKILHVKELKMRKDLHPHHK